jgi:hypothetical protein
MTLVSLIYSYNLSWDTSQSAGWVSSRMSRLVLGSTQPPSYHSRKQTLYRVKSEVLTVVLFWVVILASNTEDESCP